ncbi:MAG: hypothetical protein KME63_12215 [Candidatus Thiodiazotropha sp. (ex Clathrolucina costata)]|nr:hypothetical protein [Candidatus Thiodiazotropha taylori]
MLLDLWKSNKEHLENKHIQQIVAISGEGKLKDNSKCAQEIRAYLAEIDIDRIENYIIQCLEKSFPDSGLILQDLVNEVGRRLDFEVEDGLYQGTKNKIGYDGLWHAPGNFSIVVEVKTTDTYRISLDKLARYRKELIKVGKITEKSSILIVVGRNDTGDLEAQVRGSKHAWDIRIISAEALLTLAKIKVASEEDTSEKMRQILCPVEYTLLDGLVDIVYTTSQDTEEVGIVGDEIHGNSTKKSDKKSAWDFTETKIIDSLRNQIIERFSLLKGQQLIKRTRATYWSKNRTLRVACTISKRYEREGQRYWYAYHPAWDSFLENANDAFLILGCVDLKIIFAIPRNVILTQLQYLNTTERADNKTYWHVAIAELENNKYQLVLPKNSSSLDLSTYIVGL